MSDGRKEQTGQESMCKRDPGKLEGAVAVSHNLLPRILATGTCFLRDRYSTFVHALCYLDGSRWESSDITTP